MSRSLRSIQSEARSAHARCVLRGIRVTHSPRLQRATRAARSGSRPGRVAPRASRNEGQSRRQGARSSGSGPARTERPGLFQSSSVRPSSTTRRATGGVFSSRHVMRVKRQNGTGTVGGCDVATGAGCFRETPRTADGAGRPT